MNDIDRVINDAVQNSDLPFAVAMVADRNGVWWSGAAGDASLNHPATLDTVFKAFSMTKAVGSTAAMILMDRGLLSPDDTVESILPEFADLKLLESIGPDGPVLRTPKTRATVRHLATHTSGLLYELWDERTAQYLSATQSPSIVTGMRQSLKYPLQFEPGSQWGYGIGIDWLGQVVEKVDGRLIDQFCREEIFEPLAMRDACFEQDPSWGGRLADVKVRGEDGSFAEFELSPPARPEFHGAGQALYVTPTDYMRFLRMYLNMGKLDGNRIIGQETLRTMLQSQTGSLGIAPLRTTVPALSADLDLFPGRRKSHSMGFVRVDEDIPGMRCEGSQTWAGLLNTHFWFDPKSDLAAILMTQSLPFADPRFMSVYQAFERAVYRRRRG